MENINSVEIVDIDELMRNKLAQCDAFFNGKDAAIERVEQARVELKAAENALAEYDDVEYVEKLTAYRDDLARKLGVVEKPIVAEEVSEAQDEQNVVEVASDAVPEMVSLVL